MTFNISNKNILITGGTGQIGSFLTERLMNGNANVVVLGRNKIDLKEIQEFVDSGKIKFIECDLTNEKSIESISKFLKKINFLIHLSTEFSYSKPNSLESAHHAVALNLKGMILLLGNFNELDGIVYASTTAVYGKPAHIPVDENCPINPNTFYGSSKFGAEKYLELYGNYKKIPLSILRFSTVYGPRNRSNQIIPIFINKALQNKSIEVKNKGSRDFIYVSDVVDSIVKAMKKNESTLVNVSTGKNYSFELILKKIINITKSKSQILHLSDPQEYDFICNISKAKTKLGFSTKISIDEGLMNEINWHKNK